MANEKKVTLTIDGIDANEKKSSTKIQYVNPNISDDVMRTFANKCAALSTDTHTATTKTTDEDITNATTKPKLSLTFFNANTPQLSQPGASFLFTQTKLPNFTYKLEAEDPSSSLANVGLSVYTVGTRINYNLCLQQEWGSSVGTPMMLTIYFDETETTAATTVQITINFDTAPVLTIL